MGQGLNGETWQVPIEQQHTEVSLGPGGFLRKAEDGKEVGLTRVRN
jgi:hypothetical protein